MQRELPDQQQELREGYEQGQILQEEYENEMLAAQALTQAPAVHADEAANGAPVQEQVPAKRTFKKSRNNKKKAELARKVCPVGTAATYDMVKQLQDHRADIDNSMSPFLEEINRGGLDGRVLRTFCQGYQKDKKGRPKTTRDRRRQREDQEFLADYCSGDLERRRRHLERIVKEATYMKFPANAFSISYMRSHLSEMKNIGDKLTYLENIMNDPINREFFDNMDPALKDRLNAKGLVGARFTAALAMSCAKNGLSLNYAVYFKYGEEPNIDTGEEFADMEIENFQNTLHDYQREWGKV